MVEFKDNVSEDLEERFTEVWDEHDDALPSEVFEALEDHVESIEGTNRGRTSSAACVAREGPEAGPITLTLQNDASKSTIRHELGHAIADSGGWDCTQEATTRANNKKNWNRWPQFSFGKKDSPVERFMFRAYGRLPDLPTVELEEWDQLDGKADIFRYKDNWMETHTYRYVTGNHENKRHQDPMLYDDDEELDGVKIRSLETSSFARDVRDMDELTLVDRYSMTPGLAHITDVEAGVEWSGFGRVMYEVNVAWFKAAMLVRKRGEKREKGIAMSPRGEGNSYYLMNAHEYFAELHAMMMGEPGDDLERLEEQVPDVIEAYENALLS